MTDKAEKITPRLKTKYTEEVHPALRKEFKHGNVMEVGRIVKVVVNMGVGEAAHDSKMIEGAVRDLAAITGQKPQVTRARKSIAQFKLREGQPIGAHVTLRGDRMWEFLDRLISISLPRIRDFRGLSPKQFDGNGNYTFGLTEQAVFHEIDQDELNLIEAAENLLISNGYANVRARCDRKNIKLQMPFASMRDFLNDAKFKSVVRQLVTLGAAEVTLDLKGLREDVLHERG